MNLAKIAFNILLFFVIISHSSCETTSTTDEKSNVKQVIVSSKKPENFPEMIVPENNQLTEARINLGRKLFFDNILSSDSSVSCASCHKPALAFSDSFALSMGVEGRHADRNSPSLINAAFLLKLMREGGPPNLELQVLAPLESENEMNMPVQKACDRLNSIPEYRELFNQAYQSEATPFTLTRAIACFERTLVGGNSDFDRYLAGDSQALSDQAILGYQLFNSDRIGCGNCHAGILLTDFSFQNNGTYADYPDNGRFRLTLRDQDIGKFKVPSLRNIALTAPYMFDGHLSSLNDVLDHYASGGKDHINKSQYIRVLEISEEEKNAIIQFLESLTEEVSY